MKIKNKKSNQTYFENSNILKMKIENENTNQTHHFNTENEIHISCNSSSPLKLFN